jgi:hypothetical protein
MRRFLFVLSLAVAAQSSPSMAQSDCAAATRRWIENTVACAALFSAYAPRVYLNPGQENRAEMLRSRAVTLLRAAQRSASEIGDDPNSIQPLHNRLVDGYLKDEASIPSTVQKLRGTCDSALKNAQLSSAQLQSLLCPSGGTK